MIFITGGAYSGKTEYAMSNFKNRKIINGVNFMVREFLENGKNPETEINRLIEENAVFISDEVGCGIVPAEDFEREYREAVGRINCLLAQKAETVVRVVCGIGTVLK